MYDSQCKKAEMLKQGMRKTHAELVSKGLMIRLSEMPPFPNSRPGRRGQKRQRSRSRSRFREKSVLKMRTEKKVRTEIRVDEPDPSGIRVDQPAPEPVRMVVERSSSEGEVVVEVESFLLLSNIPILLSYPSISPVIYSFSSAILPTPK